MSKTKSFSHVITLHIRDSCLCLHTQRAARSLARRFDEALKPAGITSGQFSLLVSLNRPYPPRLGEVAELLAMDRTTLTANLKPLQREGFVDVRPDPEDRRGRILVLTPVGRKVLRRALPLWRRAARESETRLKDAARTRADLQALS
jgi:DNA-binding MarR family transcriptional regulator